MNNEIGRKLTSFTLMAIMVVGGMTMAAPGFVPAVAQSSNANLFVSSEDSRFDNYIAGPQVVEVVIRDSDINDTDESKGEPDVTVNGADLRMTQAVDGNWYGYFADRTMAQIADDTVVADGQGLDFGTIITNVSQGNSMVGISLTDTDGFAIPPNLNVVREAKDINPNAPSGTGQIGVYANVWPFIQLYDFNPTGDITVQYNKGGGAQSTTFTFDTVGSTTTLDRGIGPYPNGAQFHVTIDDTWLDIDPTDEDSWTFDTESGTTYYQVFNENGNMVGNIMDPVPVGDLMCDETCTIAIDPDPQSTGIDVLEFQPNNDSPMILDLQQQVTITESGPSSKTFSTYDENDVSTITISTDAKRGTTATFDYNDDTFSVLVGHDFATLEITPVDDTWNSGEAIPIEIADFDANKNTRADEDLILSDASVSLIPAFETGSPFTLGDHDDVRASFVNSSDGSSVLNLGSDQGSIDIQPFSDRAVIHTFSDTTITNVDLLVIDLGVTASDLSGSLNTGDNFHGYNLLNYDITSLTDSSVDILLKYSTDGQRILDADGAVNPNHEVIELQIGASGQGLDLLGDTATAISELDADAPIAIAYMGDVNTDASAFVTDFFSFGFYNKGELGGERIYNQIIRVEVEETGDNTSLFYGELEYVMLNQLNILDPDTYTGLDTISDEPTFIVAEDFTDEDSIRVNYLDLGADGVSTQVADQEEAPSHSAVVSLDMENYKVADTVTITLEDADLNVDSDLIEVYTIADQDNLPDTVGDYFNVPLIGTNDLGRVLDVTFDDSLWTTPVDNMCGTESFTGDTGLAATGFTLVETGTDTGVFRGDFQIPTYWCNDGSVESTTGLDIEVNYVDFRDASGEIIEVGDGAAVRANTGSISLDRTVYPVPFGTPSDFEENNSTSADGRSVFPLHQTAGGEFLTNGDLSVHIRVNDADYDISAAGEDVIADSGHGPVKISVIRGSNVVVLGYAGGDSADGKIGIGANAKEGVNQFGPIEEIAPDAGIFEADITVRYTDGPASTQCPDSDNAMINDRFMAPPESGDYCILQGDILQVEYTDPTDASGSLNSVTDSATFDLRNGVLQSDKSVYLIGSDIILTLIEPDFDLDNDQAETYSLDLIEWDSDAATLTMGSLGDPNGAFDPEPSDFRETGDSTGIFQVVIETPGELDGDTLERGEEIELEYTDWGPSGSDYVGDEDEDIGLTIFTSNYGATIELDQKVYTWTDKVYITIVAPDHNFDSNLVDEIGETSADPIKISSRSSDIDNYKLVETGADTGIFTGEVILTGFEFNADGDTTTGDVNGNDVTDRAASGEGPTDGLLPSDDEDGITVSFEFSEDETIVGSAIIRWNIGEVQWLEASYPATGTGLVRVIDPDMNLNPEAVDNFDVDVWSETDSGGIDLTVNETNEATGIFEGTVSFTVVDESTGHRLRVAEGDTVTVEYEDNTLPDPYTTADELDVTATTLIGTIVPPLERAPASNLRLVNSSNNSVDMVSVNEQVQVQADLVNGQDRDQAFAYLVQIQDEGGVTVALDWISGTLTPNQSLSPAKSWLPTDAGSYTVTVFVWESVDSPTALSPPLSTAVTVN